MADPLNIAILGLTHDHVWDHVPSLIDSPDVRLVAAADVNAPLREKLQSLHACNVYDAPDKLLDAETLDAVCIFSSNSEGAACAVDAANRGLHVLIEKPMAATLEQAEQMLAASTQRETRLMINWPFAWWPQMQHAITLAQSEDVGWLWQVKYRAAHAGPAELGCSEFFCDWLFDEQRNGGGALMDYCCYGANLARTLMGRPEAVTAVKGRFCKKSIPVEDNALIAMEYPDGLATAEASWSQIGKLTSYITAIYGTSGTLMVEPRTGGRLLRADENHPDGVPVDVPAPPPHMSDPIAHFVHGIRTGEPFQPLCDAKKGRDVQEILEAGLQAAATGSRVSLPL